MFGVGSIGVLVTRTFAISTAARRTAVATFVAKAYIEGRALADKTLELPFPHASCWGVR